MTYSIQDYGALPNGSLCTKQIQAAIDACFLNGGGEVVFSRGTYLVGGLRLRSGVTLHLLEDAVLMGSTDPDDYTDFLRDELEPITSELLNNPVSTVKKVKATSKSVYPCSRWNNAIIRAIFAKNIAIIGEKGSEINGQNCFDPTGEESYRGPHAINMWFCEDVVLRGYTIRDSANWAHAIQNSQRISAKNITVLGGHDGFDVRTCDDITIEDSVFRTGDDCVAGFDNLRVTVKNCVLESACSMMRFGGTDVLVEGCRGIAPATYGFRGSLSPEEKRNRMPTNSSHRHNCLNVFLYYCDGRAAVRETPGKIVIRNSHFQNPDAIMRLPFGHKWCCNRSLNDITFENCVFDGVCSPMQLNCPEEEPLTLRMKNCTVTAREGYEQIALVTGRHIRQIELDEVKLLRFVDPKIVCETDVNVTVTDSCSNG